MAHRPAEPALILMQDQVVVIAHQAGPVAANVPSCCGLDDELQEQTGIFVIEKHQPPLQAAVHDVAPEAGGGDSQWSGHGSF